MSKTARRVLLIVLAALAVTFVVWVIVSVDGPGLPPFITQLYTYPNGDKLGHFLLMGLLAFLIALALPQRWQIPALLLLALVLTGEEFSQRFFSVRHSDWLDLACSLAGMTVFGGLALWLTRRKQRSFTPVED